MAKLPKIPQRVCSTKLPSTGKPIKFRPWQAREERLLLIAKDGEDKPEILSTVTQVVNNITLDTDFDVNRAPIFDIEYLFIQGRIKSVGSTVERAYQDREDGQRYELTVDLEKVEVVFPEAPKNVIDFGEGIAVTLKWPSTAAFSAKEIVDASTKDDSEEEVERLLVPDLIDKIYDGDNVHDASTYTREELIEFVDTFPTDKHAHALEYLATMPRLEYKMEYTNKNGKVRRFTLSNLSDFFTFR